jgi:peptide/nickel transport system ATP-binding protein/oligopeptide transport system ATP-binding protein
MDIVELKNVSKIYRIKESAFARSKSLTAVDNVSLSIREKETVGLVGESGCGKSTLGKLIVKLEKPSSGEVIVNQKNLWEAKANLSDSLKGFYQMIFQDPYNSLNPQKRIYDILDEILKLYTSIPLKERHSEILRLLDIVGLKKEHMFRYPRQFSGGQRQRIGIARALAVNPKIIVADESVSSLDVSIQAQIINLFSEIQNQTRVSFLFISHDLAVVESICDRIMVMYLGRIVESGPANKIISNPSHPYTSALIEAIPVPDVNRKIKNMIKQNIPSPIDLPQGCRFNTRCPYAFDRCFKEEPELELLEKTTDHYCSCFLRKNQIAEK